MNEELIAALQRLMDRADKLIDQAEESASGGGGDASVSLFLAFRGAELRLMANGTPDQIRNYQVTLEAIRTAFDSAGPAALANHQSEQGSFTSKGGDA